ncbi:MAG: hypothetical protein SGILL_001526 [Bacillariaceae sp.]
MCNSHVEVAVGLSVRPSKAPSPSSRRSQQRSGEEENSQSSPSSPPSPERKIEFVNFWGSKSKKDDDDDDAGISVDPRKVPCVETLDLHDGPLPPGAYLQEGKEEWDAKSTCRIGLNVQLGNNRNGDCSKVGMEDMVQRLQKCIDAGFSTFQLQHQSRRGLELIKKLKHDTPIHVETHWSLRHQVPTAFTSSNPRQQQLETRQSIVALVEQTGGDALDSLQILYNPVSPYTLDVLNHLAELQQEGYIRSIGVRDMPPRRVTEMRKARLADVIDFQQQSGNLLLPPEECDSSLNLWMGNVLASHLLTTTIKDPLQMTRGQESVLNEWAVRWGAMENDSTICSDGGNDHDATSTTFHFSTMRLWNMYQDQVVETLQWVALKHRVSPMTVAIRWALDQGPDSVVQNENGRVDTLPGVVSSGIIDCPLDVEMFDDLPVEWRKVFRFALDPEDKEMLKECSAPTLADIQRTDELRTAKSSSSTKDLYANPDDALNDWERELLEYQRALDESNESFAQEEYPDIDISNQALWL